MHYLTEGKILKKKAIRRFFAKKIDQLILTNAKYYFLIISVTQNFTKLTIYPLETPLILKIILNGSKMEQMHILSVTKKIIDNNIALLHTSGLVAVQESYIDELYLKSDEVHLKSFRDWLFNNKSELQIDVIEESWFRY